MDLKEMIYKRKSVRSYTGVPVDEPTLQKIRAFRMQPLYPDIRVRWEILPREQVKCICPWTTPQLICIYSEEAEGYLENVGFLFQQLDLYLQSIGLGTCWLGMGRLSEKEKAEGFVIMLAFGYPKGQALREHRSEFKRKPLAEISDWEDRRLEPARFAPSSVNSQPWYFIHSGETIHAYCAMQGFLKSKALGNMNRIDMGIALAHLYVSHPDTFRFYRKETPVNVKGYGYIGSATL